MPEGAPRDPRLRYDRGTLLVEGSGGAFAETLPGLVWDPRVGSLRATAHRYSSILAALDRAGLRVDDSLAARPLPALAVRSPELRPYQYQALLAWEMAGRRGLLALPTGSGKTLIAIAAISRLRCATLVLVPTRVLLEQWGSVLRSFHDGPIGVVGDGSRTVEPLTVATFESAYLYMDCFGDRFGLLVVDEAHHFGSGARREALEMCSAPARLGLTGTPPEQPGSQARLDDLVGPLVCRYSIGQLSGRHLAPLDRVRLQVELSGEESAAYSHGRAAFERCYRALRERRGDLSWTDFVVTASMSREGRRALAGFHESRRVVAMAEAKLRLAEQVLGQHRGERSLVFTADNRVAYALSRRLLIPALTCDIGRAERRSVLEAVRAGRLESVISSRVLNEGLDLPEARIGVILGGTLGGREHAQRVGRLLRPLAGKRAVVYELVANRTFEVGHAERRDRYLDS